MNGEENIAIVKRYYDEVVNQGKLDMVDELFAPDFTGFKVEGVEGGSSRADIKETCRSVRVAFPDYNHHVDEYIAAGNTVVTRGTTTGTHLGPYGNVAATGKRMKGTVTEIWRLENGKVREHWFEADMLGSMIQFGAVPPWEQLGKVKWVVEDTSAAAIIEQNKALVRKYVDAFNQQDVATLDELLAPEVAAPIKQSMQWVYATFAGHHIDIVDMVAEGDKVWSLVNTRGGHSAEFEGIPATGKQWTNQGVSFERIVDGKVVESGSLFDVYGHLKQLGAKMTLPN